MLIALLVCTAASVIKTRSALESRREVAENGFGHRPHVRWCKCCDAFVVRKVWECISTVWSEIAELGDINFGSSTLCLLVLTEIWLTSRAGWWKIIDNPTIRMDTPPENVRYWVIHLVVDLSWVNFNM